MSERRAKNSKNAMSVLLLGLNHFRKLNEVMGTWVVTKRCRKSARGYAMAPIQATSSRGSVTDEFALVWQAGTQKTL